LELEKQSLLKYYNPSLNQKLNQVESEQNALNQQILAIKNKWDTERGAFLRLKEAKQKIKQIQEKVEDANFIQDLMGQNKEEDLEPLQQEVAKLEAFLKTSEYIRMEVTPEVIASVVSKWTGIPVSNLLTPEKEKLLHLEEYLHKKVIAQESAISAVSNTIRRSRAGLKAKNRPVGSFIFLGPTGVGKTELAKTLADFLFDSPKAMLRFDMSEYMEKYSVSRLIGSPPGYVGYDQGGQLTEQVRRHPYSVILFDEIEKADPEIFNIFLQVLDDGRLTDSQGRTIDFTNTIIVFTSNLGSSEILDLIKNEKSSEEIQTTVQHVLEKKFKPEFINRIDDVVVFQALNIAQIGQIADLYFKELAEKLWEQGMSLQISAPAREHLINLGFDPQYGARPLRRVISREVENRIAQHVLSRVVAGQTIHINYAPETGIVVG
jgi:ATP-dependent Clp protease ATP-binding subunit ClpB